MERTEEERREAKDKAPGPQEGRGWPSTGVPQKSATGQDSRSPPPHPSNTGDEGERFRNGGWDRSPPLYAPLPNRVGNEKGHWAAPIRRPPAFHTGKTASPAGTKAHYAVKGLSPLLTIDTPLTFKNGGFQSILGSDYR